MIALLVAFSSFFLNLLLCIKFQGLSSPPKAEANPDQVEYELFAYQMSEGRGFTWPTGEVTACRPPGTSFTLLPVYWLFGRSFSIGRLWFCLLTTVTCIATGWIAWQVCGPVAALFAMAFLGFYPGHFYYSMHFLSEIPFGLWIALACGFTLTATRSLSPLYSFVAGVFWGLAILTRPQMILVLPIALVCVAASTASLRARFFKILALQLVAAVLVLLPWTARNAIVIGKPALCTIVGGFTFWGANNDVVAAEDNTRGSWIPVSRLVDATHPLVGNETEREATAWKYGREFLMNHPTQVPRLLFMKVVRLFSPLSDTTNRLVGVCFAVGWILMAPLALIGFLALRRRDSVATTVLMIPCVATLATTLVFYGSDRFRDGLSPIWIVFAAVATLELANRRREAPHTVLNT